jgi:hypothetical protein
VTNSLNYLSQCDEILMLDNGSITSSGKYDELKFKISKISNFLDGNNNQNKINDEGTTFLNIFYIYFF